MILVTGGAGFVGSNLIRALNARGEADLLVVDDLRRGEKFQNLVDCEIMDYRDRDDFLAELRGEAGPDLPLEAVLHFGACTSTTERDGRYMMRYNYEHSKLLLDYALQREIPFLYASCASVYGAGSIFREERQFEAPPTMAGYTRFLFDQHVRRRIPAAGSPVVGLRLFDAYGPREAHKGEDASAPWRIRGQIREDGRARLYRGGAGGDGEQRRDFVHVDDVVAVALWFLDHPEHPGIFNVGTGRSRSFNEVARVIIDWHGHGGVEYIALPESPGARPPDVSEADITALRDAGYSGAFTAMEDGVRRYMEWLEENIPD